MAEIYKNLAGRFIGTVYGYDKETRELDVFIPKLMPAIPQGQGPRTVMTNLGNNSIPSHSDKITLVSTIKVKAKDIDEPLPDINSKVLIIFYDEKFEYGYWEKFKPDETKYTVIEEEKYPEKFKLRVNDKEAAVNLSDTVILNFSSPDEESSVTVTKVENRDEKNIEFNIELKNSLEEKVNALAQIVGEDDNNGLRKRVYDLENLVQTLLDEIKNLKNK